MNKNIYPFNRSILIPLPLILRDKIMPSIKNINIKKLVSKIMRRLKRQGFLKHLGILQQETFEEDIFELLEEWSLVTEDD